jgi:hypothetical protein
MFHNKIPARQWKRVGLEVFVQEREEIERERARLQGALLDEEGDGKASAHGADEEKM